MHDNNVKNRIKNSKTKYTKHCLIFGVEKLAIARHSNNRQQKILLEQLNIRLENKNIILRFSEKVIDRIIEEGYDPDFGARPLKRFIQRDIETVVASKIINGEIEDNAIVNIDFINNKLIFSDLKSSEKIEM